MRKWVVIGSIGAAALILLAMVPLIVDAQTMKSDEIKYSIFQQIKNKTENKLWEPGDTLEGILMILVIIIMALLGIIEF